MIIFHYNTHPAQSTTCAIFINATLCPTLVDRRSGKISRFILLHTPLLAIESSCDDSSVAVLDGDRITYSTTISQKHQNGVFPEYASRMHAENIWKLLRSLPCPLTDLRAIAVTTHPGLIGSLRVGVTIAKTLSWTLNIPLLSVNHVNAHILTPLWSTKIQVPYLALVASGGHTLLAEVRSPTEISIIGCTLDDAVGEVFDKTARMLGLAYPGGPMIEQFAKNGISRFKLPIPMRHHPGYDFSFSGFKEHVRQKVQQTPVMPDTLADWAASIQFSLTQALITRTEKALPVSGFKQLALVGGVAANAYMRTTFETMCSNHGVEFFAPPKKVCGDNAEMIAWVGLWQLQRGEIADLTMMPRPKYCDK